MPRKLRRPKARTQVPVSRALFHYLLWNDINGASDLQDENQTEPFELFFRERYPEAWRAIEPEAIEVWVQTYPGCRPASWWRWSAPELRQLSGGAYRPVYGDGRCHETGIPYISLTDGGDPPLVESEAALLDRLNLFLPGERARVPLEAFAPQVFSYSLGWAPQRAVPAESPEGAA